MMEHIVLTVVSRAVEAQEVFGSDDDSHPGIKFLFNTAKEFYVGGKLQAVSRLEHYDFLELRCKFYQVLPLRQQKPVPYDD
jgi:ATP sulfurylase